MLLGEGRGRGSISLGPGQGGGAGPQERSQDNHLHNVSSTGRWSRFYAYILMQSLQCFYSRGNRSSGRLGYFPKVTQLVGDKAGIQIQPDSRALSFPLNDGTHCPFTTSPMKMLRSIQICHPREHFLVCICVSVYVFVCVHVYTHLCRHACTCVCRICLLKYSQILPLALVQETLKKNSSPRFIRHAGHQSRQSTDVS